MRAADTCQSGPPINSNTQKSLCHAHVDAEYHRNHSALFVLELVFLLAGKDEGMDLIVSPEIILREIHTR